MARGPFDCQHCTWGRHCDETNPASHNQWVIPGVIESRICLLPMVNEFSALMIRMHRHYRHNILLRPGGILDQPHPYVRAMEIIDRAVDKSVSNGDTGK